MSKSKPNVTFSAGFLRAREAVLDSSNGHEETVAGVYMRVRLSDIVWYAAATKDIVEIQLRHFAGQEVLAIYATIEEVDGIMDRENMRISVVPNG